MANASAFCRLRLDLTKLYRPRIADDTIWRAQFARTIARNSCLGVGLRVPPIAHRPAAAAAGKINSSTIFLRICSGLGSAPRLGSLRVRRPSGFGSPIDFPHRCAAPPPCTLVLAPGLYWNRRRAGLRLGCASGRWAWGVGKEPIRPDGYKSREEPASRRAFRGRVHLGRQSLPRSQGVFSDFVRDELELYRLNKRTI